MFNTQVNYITPCPKLIKAMNIQKLRKTAPNVNYIKPQLEMLEMDVEGVLCNSFTTGYPDDPNAGKPGETVGGGGIVGRSSKVRTRR